MGMRMEGEMGRKTELHSQKMTVDSIILWATSHSPPSPLTFKYIKGDHLITDQMDQDSGTGLLGACFVTYDQGWGKVVQDQTKPNFVSNL